jgi:cytochrome P450
LRQTEGCLLDALLRSTDESGAGMTDKALRDELMTLLVAGQETSAILLAWASARLAHHPAVQSAVQREVDSVLQGALPDASNVRCVHSE